MEKGKVIKSVLQELEKKRLELEKSVEEFRKSANQSSKSTESWSDSSRSQFNMMAGAIQNDIKMIESSAVLLKTFENSSSGVIGIGSLVVVEADGQEKCFFIVPEGAGGFSVKVDDGEIIVLASSSPIGSVLVGKRIKEKTEFNGKKLEIISIN